MAAETSTLTGRLHAEQFRRLLERAAREKPAIISQLRPLLSQMTQTRRRENLRENSLPRGMTGLYPNGLQAQGNEPSVKHLPMPQYLGSGGAGISGPNAYGDCYNNVTNSVNAWDIAVVVEIVMCLLFGDASACKFDKWDIFDLRDKILEDWCQCVFDNSCCKLDDTCPCKPNCKGKECGPDGCGGSCDNGKQCNPCVNGKCCHLFTCGEACGNQCECDEKAQRCLCAKDTNQDDACGLPGDQGCECPAPAECRGDIFGYINLVNGSNSSVSLPYTKVSGDEKVSHKVYEGLVKEWSKFEVYGDPTAYEWELSFENSECVKPKLFCPPGTGRFPQKCV